MTRISRRRTKVVAMKERYRLCSSCGNFAHFNEKLTYCTLCGEKLIDQCGNCAEPIIYPTARFCPACGVSLLTPTQPTRTEQSEDRQQTGSRDSTNISSATGR